MRLFFLPFVHSSQDTIFLIYILMRVIGLFGISPLLSNAGIPMRIKAFLTVIITLLISFTLYPDYRGANARYLLAELTEGSQSLLIPVIITCLKELLMGYLIGFCFTILFESLLFAGQVTGFMVGFSMARLIDPVSGTSQAVLSQLFVIISSLIILCTDLHHVFFQTLSHSFRYAPLGTVDINHKIYTDFTQGTGRIFVYGIRFSVIPYVVLFLIIVGLGFLAKVMPELNVFMLGFALKILIGFYTLIIAIGFFPPLIQQIFVECHNLAGLVIRHVGKG